MPPSIGDQFVPSLTDKHKKNVSPSDKLTFICTMFGLFYSLGRGAGLSSYPADGAGSAAFSIIPSRSLVCSSTAVVPVKAVDTIHKAKSAVANIHVPFSKKSEVRCTPTIWLDDENPEANPPPFEF